jgi:hypothetical protein
MSKQKHSACNRSYREVFKRVIWSHLAYSTFQRLRKVGTVKDCYIFFKIVRGGGDRLCGLVVRLTGCRPRGSGLDSRRCQIF